MQALVLRQFGDPKLLKVEEVPTPQPSSNEALVEIKAAAINPSDIKNVQGSMHGTTLPRIPGRDFAGTVVQGPPNLIGHDVWGTGGDIGFTRDGSHALAPKPAKLSMDAAGSAGLVFITAWSALITAAHVAENEVVLIIGAAGGVGSAAIQIAHARGAKVIAAIRSQQDADRIRQSSVEDIVNTTDPNWTQSVRSMTNGSGANVIFDTSGLLFPESLDAAAHAARLCIISSPPDGKSTFNLRNLYRNELRVFGVDTRSLGVIACAAILGEMRALFEFGKFRVIPGQSCPLADAPQAYAQVAAGKGHFFLSPKIT
jgi:NADPH:quinone reductase